MTRIAPILIAFAAAMSLCSTSRAANPPPMVKQPGANSPWSVEPAQAQLRQVSPPGGARAVLRCHVEAAGSLSACVTVSETPAASGFGAAAIALSSAYRLKPSWISNEAQDGSLTFSIDSFATDSEPGWLRKPSSHDLMTVWPRAALRKGIGGSAVVSCVASTQGALFDCVAIHETPEGMGFGAAALALTPQFLMTPARLKGEPVLSVINIPIEFISEGRVYNPAFTPAVVPAAMVWPLAPSFADMAAVYPKAAREAHLAGRATLLCGFDTFGHLDSCRTIAEEPKGHGFGNAAHLLLRRFRAPPKTANGRPIGQAELQLPFVFDPAVLDAQPPRVDDADWAVLPTPAQTQAAGAGLAKAGLGAARVSLECTVQQGGGLADCAVASEDPAGKGAGAAALSLVPDYRVSTWTSEGLPTVGGRIRLPVRLDAAAARPLAPGSAP